MEQGKLSGLMKDIAIIIKESTFIEDMTIVNVVCPTEHTPCETISEKTTKRNK